MILLDRQWRHGGRRAGAIAALLPQLQHGALERVDRLVERQAQIGPRARGDDPTSAGLAGDADLLVAVSEMAGRATGVAHVD